MIQTTTDPARPAAKGSGLRGLIALNALLLGALALITFAPRVTGQPAARQRGDYTMVAGGVNGIDSDAVYIVDSINQEMIAITYEQATRDIDGLGFVNLAADARDAARPRTNTPVQP